jgi:hypothetical protein
MNGFGEDYLLNVAMPHSVELVIVLLQHSGGRVRNWAQHWSPAIVKHLPHRLVQTFQKGNKPFHIQNSRVRVQSGSLLAGEFGMGMNFIAYRFAFRLINPAILGHVLA